jgi:hypothetical protein
MNRFPGVLASNTRVLVTRLVDIWFRHSKATEAEVVWAYLMSFRDGARFSTPVGSYTLSRILDAIQPRCLLGVASNLN